MDASSDVLDVLGRLILANRGRWVAVARAEGLDAQDAIECVQDGLCTVLRGFSTEEVRVPHARLGGYIARVVRNAARNGRRRHHRSRTHLPLEGVELVDDLPSSEDLVQRAEEHVRLHALSLIHI